MHTPAALEFVEMHAEDGRQWGLFADDDRFELGWSELQPDPLAPDADRFYEIHAGTEAVARLHLDWRTDSSVNWSGAPPLGAKALRIQMIEVAASLRGCGLGRAIVYEIQARHPDSRLIAMSVREAEGFWSSLAWKRFEHAQDRYYQRLFVGPAGNLARGAASVGFRPGVRLQV